MSETGFLLSRKSGGRLTRSGARGASTNAIEEATRRRSQ